MKKTYKSNNDILESWLKRWKEDNNILYPRELVDAPLIPQNSFAGLSLTEVQLIVQKKESNKQITAKSSGLNADAILPARPVTHGPAFMQANRDSDESSVLSDDTFSDFREISSEASETYSVEGNVSLMDSDDDSSVVSEISYDSNDSLMDSDDGSPEQNTNSSMSNVLAGFSLAALGTAFYHYAESFSKHEEDSLVDGNASSEASETYSVEGNVSLMDSDDGSSVVSDISYDRSDPMMESEKDSPEKNTNSSMSNVLAGFSLAALGIAFYHYAGSLFGGQTSQNLALDTSHDNLTIAMNTITQYGASAQHTWSDLSKFLSNYIFMPKMLQDVSTLSASGNDQVALGQALANIYASMPTFDLAHPQSLVEYVKGRLVSEYAIPVVLAGVVATGAMAMYYYSNGVQPIKQAEGFSSEEVEPIALKADVLGGAISSHGNNDVVSTSNKSAISKYLTLSGLAIAAGSAVYLAGGPQVALDKCNMVVRSVLSGFFEENGKAWVPYGTLTSLSPYAGALVTLPQVTSALWTWLGVPIDSAVAAMGIGDAQTRRQGHNMLEESTPKSALKKTTSGSHEKLQKKVRFADLDDENSRANSSSLSGSSCSFIGINKELAEMPEGFTEVNNDCFKLGYHGKNADGQDAMHSVEWSREENSTSYHENAEHREALDAAVSEGFEPHNLHIAWNNTEQDNQLPASYWAGVHSFEEADKLFIHDDRKKAVHLNDCRDGHFFRGVCDMIRHRHGVNANLSRYLSNYKELSAKFPPDQNNRLREPSRLAGLQKYFSEKKVRHVNTNQVSDLESRRNTSPEPPSV